MKHLVNKTEIINYFTVKTELHCLDYPDDLEEKLYHFRRISNNDDFSWEILFDDCWVDWSNITFDTISFGKVEEAGYTFISEYTIEKLESEYQKLLK